MTAMSLLSSVLLVLLVLLTGGLLAITPWLMRRNECFAVTIPADKQNDERLVALKRSYSKTMVVITGALALAEAVALFFLMRLPSGVSDAALATIVSLGVLVPLVLSFALMLRSRRRVQALKAAEGWHAVSQQTAALIAEGEAPRAVSLAWNLLYLPVVAASMVLAYALYPSMPDVIPMHMNFAGEVDSFASKSSVFAYPLLISAFMALTMAFCHWTILRSKRPTDLGAPATSAYAYGMFARAQSIFLLVTGLAITAAIDFGIVLSAAGLISLGQMAVFIVALAVVVTVGAVALSVVYGQAGSKIHARMIDVDGGSPLAFDDDEHWILGIIYLNRDDASLFLPERFGVGWTINMARPAAWLILAGFVLLTIAFIAAVAAIA